jgi:hypothetical protein
MSNLMSSSSDTCAPQSGELKNCGKYCIKYVPHVKLFGHLHLRRENSKTVANTVVNMYYTVNTHKNMYDNIVKMTKDGSDILDTCLDL